MEIPKKAKINKKTYAVHRVHSFKCGKLGEIHYANQVIKIARHALGGTWGKHQYRMDLSKEEQWEVFWHEVVHGILHDMKRHDLNNERFVNAFCRRLYGVLKEK